MNELQVNALIVKTRGKAYMYDVLLEIPTDKKIYTINKDKIDLHEKISCRALVALAYEATQHFGNPKLVYAYDGSAILYTNVPILGIEYVIEHQRLTHELAKSYRHDISLKITPTTNHHVLDLDKKIESMNVDELSEYKRFISIGICQDAINRGVYSVLDQSSIFSLEKPKITRNGIEFRAGFSKGVNLVKNDAEIKTAFIIDARTCIFYKSQDILSAANEIGIKNADDFMKGVTVFPSYNPHRRLHFNGFTGTTPATEKFNNEKTGKEMSIFEYFKEIKKVSINPNVPLAAVRPRQAGTFPSEQLIILPYQRVALERLDSRLVDELHEANAVVPNMRYRAIWEIIRELRLDNLIMKAFGLEARPEFIHTPSHPILRPKIQFGGSLAQPRDDGIFRDPRARYVAPATVNKWVVLYSNYRVDKNIVNRLVQNLMEKGKHKGMTVTPPVDIVQVDMRNFVEKTYPKCAEYMRNGVRFILVIDPKEGSETHKAVKLIECRYHIVTQQLSYQLVFDCVTKNQNVTLENILNKMNLKNGGCNYAPKFEHGAESLALDKGTFVVGYQARHSKIVPQRVSTDNVAVREPSAIGFSGNYARNPNLFVGNFLYQVDPRSDVDFELADLVTLEEQMTHMLRLLASNRKNDAKPHTIVILRDGVSEYQYDILKNQEIPALRRGCHKIDPNWKPKFIYAVTTKEHNTRLFEKSGNRISNPLPGTFVTEAAVHKDKEFIMTPHKALKGTARPVKVTILLNETGVGLGGIRNFIHALSYSHQLTCAPTALPEPIYQSGILSQRAHAVLSAMKEYFPNAVPRQQHQYDIPMLNTRLSFRGSPLENVRFSA
ncbi:hypothetical protein FO519_003736 [Halicephalobus sp. NKZ332]|nr:hypothetical protein FO519_003736 [Halicephalobus sp. NKZ332]